MSTFSFVVRLKNDRKVISVKTDNMREYIKSDKKMMMVVIIMMWDRLNRYFDINKYINIDELLNINDINNLGKIYEEKDIPLNIREFVCREIYVWLLTNDPKHFKISIQKYSTVPKVLVLQQFIMYKCSPYQKKYTTYSFIATLEFRYITANIDAKDMDDLIKKIRSNYILKAMILISITLDDNNTKVLSDTSYRILCEGLFSNIADLCSKINIHNEFCHIDDNMIENVIKSRNMDRYVAECKDNRSPFLCVIFDEHNYDDTRERLSYLQVYNIGPLSVPKFALLYF